MSIFILCSFPGKAAGVKISAQAPSTEAAPAKEAPKVCLAVLLVAVFVYHLFF